MKDENENNLNNPEEQPLSSAEGESALSKGTDETAAAPAQQSEESVDSTADDSTADDSTADNSPVDNSPVDNSPVDDSPVDDSPVDDSPVDDSPVDDSTADNSTADENNAVYTDGNTENSKKKEKKPLPPKTKKLLYILIPVIAVVLAAAVTLTILLVSRKNKSKAVFVTDVNGVVVTDVNGHPITVVPETQIVKTTDKFGNTVTSVVYKPVTVEVPVTDADGKAVTDENGKVVTEKRTITPTFPNKDHGNVIGSTAVPVTDGRGNTATDPQGNVLTTVIPITTIPTPIEPAKTEWKSTLGGSQMDYFSAVIKTSDGGYVAANVTCSKDGDFKKYADTGYRAPYTVLIKYNKTGDVVWEEAVGNKAGLTEITSLAATSDGGFYAAGYSQTKGNNGYYDAAVYKFNKNGKEEWSNLFGTSTVDMFKAVAVTKDGGVIAAGSVGTNDGDAAGTGGKAYNSRACAVKYTSGGSLSWKRMIGGNMDIFNGAAVGSDGSIYLVGNFYSGELFPCMGKSDSGVVKLSSAGKYIDVKPIAGTGIENFSAIVVGSDGGIYVSGRSNSSDTSNTNSFFNGNLASRGGYDAYFIKLDKNLSVAFATPFRGQNDDSLDAITQLGDGSFILAGKTNSSTRDLKGVTTRGGDDIVIASFTKTGDLSWARSFGGTSNDSASGICAASDGGYVVVGDTFSSNVDLASISPYTGNGKSVGVIVKFPE